MFGYYKLRRNLKNIYLKNKYHRGESNFSFRRENDELYLFGNGYSLDLKDVKNIKDKDCFICNRFYKVDFFEEFIFGNNVLDFSMDSFRSKLTRVKSRGTSLSFEIDEHLLPKLKLKIPLVKTLDFFPYVLHKSPDHPIITPEGLAKSLGFSLKDFLSNNFGHTPQIMILMGILFGYKKIHLFGLEHNYVKDILNKDPRCGTHFYGDAYEEVLILDRGLGGRDHYRITLSKLFRGNADIFEGYEQLADLAKERGVEIIDHSGGSLFMFQDYSLWDLVETPNKN